MKYEEIIVIDAPRDEVITRFSNAENLKHWQEGFLNYRPISGKPGQLGSQSELTYKMGNREIIMKETISHNNFPDALHATYEADGVFNQQQNFFEVYEDDKTLWRSVSEFKFTGILMKAMGFLMPGAFKKQSRKYMTDFKAWVENGTSVAP
ncbi:SRPBCC family protein [Robertkochia solimangrovi]|uniref:SRPBCC family protein n=1 Tax=Robertkochia solimangrovi TaxID=2213046 RepID=UPI00117DAA44|nr:SRPBCC family protein [Robertkochia solimangrovi]TRZ42763.1 SRPBCC family protein [Robertkochia solimangrovi]